MVILAIDHGTKYIGLAVSDETGLVAAPLPPLKVKSQQEAVEGVLFVADDVRAEMILIGLPSGWENDDSPQTKLVRKFVSKLQAENPDMKTALWDESYTSQQAEKRFKGKSKHKAHSEAARIILQEYLERE